MTKTDTQPECPTCAGKETAWAFGKYCDKHNVCVQCGIHRSQLNGKSAWAVRVGAFMCDDCSESNRKLRIAERQKAGFDHEYTDEIVCPHCGYEHGDSWEAGDDESDCECPECHGKYNMRRYVEVSYITEKAND